MSIFGNGLETLKERENNFIKRINEKFPTFEYVSGYTDSECEVILKCKECGTEIMRHSSIARSKKQLTCFNCLKIKKKNKKRASKMKNEQRLHMLKVQTSKRKDLDNFYKYLKENTLYIRTCQHCGNEYIEHTTSCYCAKCRKHIRNKHSGKSLTKLYERDKGICYICGEKCDWNDKKIVNGTILVGNNYPSVDHVIPLAKGGTDDWNNLKLAHFKCNWVKGAI